MIMYVNIIAYTATYVRMYVCTYVYLSTYIYLELKATVLCMAVKYYKILLSYVCMLNTFRTHVHTLNPRVNNTCAYIHMYT